MKTRLLLPLMLGCAFAASAEDPGNADMNVRVNLAAANAPGDLLSDAYLVPMIDLALEADAPGRELDPELRKSLEQARDDLAQRVDSAADEVPVGLYTTVNCMKKGADARECSDSRERLAGLAKENGYHHFVLMSMAARRGDEDAFATHGEKLIAAPRFDPDLVPVFASLHARYSQVPDALWQHPENEYGPEAAPGVQAMAIAAAVVLPGYQPFMQACEKDDADRRTLCVAVASRMAERSTVLLDRLIGVALIKKIGTPAEQQGARELEREAKWLLASVANFGSELDDGQWGRYYEIFASEGEFAAMRYAAQATGRSLEPPADWQPK
ncbi:hypothetical protein [uncultured Arenimonas sp.]|uniref:hypothetical protein n=1 Tax=uncultured Arenimonas sp. TaxID=546226 RepID=UPI0030DC11E5